MFSNYHWIGLTFHSFYIFFYSSFLELQLNLYKLFFFPRLFIHQVCSLGYWFDWYKYPSSYSFKSYFIHCWLVCIIFIGSMFIDPETCPRVQIQIFSWAYPNPTYRFASPAVLWKSMARVPVFVIAPAAINTFLHNIGYSM